LEQLMSQVGKFEVVGKIGVVTIDNPPVNALGIETRRALDACFREAAANAAVAAVVLICGGRTFFAGASLARRSCRPDHQGYPAGR